MDYLVGLPEDKDGNTRFIVLVAAGAGVGAGVPVKTRGGPEALECYKRCSQRLLLSYPVGTVISRVHSDCEKSLIAGPLLEHLKNQGVWPTETEGYDHNANAVVEVRIKQLSRAVRASLLDCTGGRGRYQEIWGDLYEHAIDVINNTEHSGEMCPIAKAGSKGVDVESDDFHVFGSEVHHFLAVERREGKLDMPTRRAYYAGRSDKIANGHKVVQIDWNDRTKSYDLGPTEHVANVIVNDAVFPLRQMPQRGCSKLDFDTFVDRFDSRSVVDDTFQVKAIIDHRYASIGPRSRGGKDRKQLEYLVHWKGYTKREATWEPAHYLSDAEESVAKYKKKAISIKLSK
jgi:hypothetical protein